MLVNALRDDLGVLPPESNTLFSVIAKEVGALAPEAKERVKSASPISVAARLQQLGTFNEWMILFHGSSSPSAAMAHAQVITNLYISFVYLSEACFKVLLKELPTGSTLKKCCKFLTDNLVCALRNAVAHSNWHYLPDLSGFEFWAKKGSDPKELPSRFEVSQHDISFWQSLALCSGYASYHALSI